MATVNDLPDEMLLEVFFFLSVPDVAKVVANVCVRWRLVAQDATLWRKLELTLDQTQYISCFKALLPHLPELRRIKVQWRAEIPEIVEALSLHCPKLESLVLRTCGNFSQSCIKHLERYRETLRVFDIGKSWVVSNKCIDGVGMFENLIDLNLSHNAVTHEQFKSLSESCTKVVYLNIDFVRGITEEDLVMFLTPREDRMRSLQVFGELLTDNIFKHIEKCSVLSLLYISRCSNFSDNCLKSINMLTTLKSLTLKRAQYLTPKTLSIFYFESHVVKTLRHLYISAKRIVTEEDLLIWPKDNSMFDQSVVNHFCTCILTKRGFTTLKRLY